MKKWLLVAILLCCALTFARCADNLVQSNDDEFEDEEFETKPRPGVPLRDHKAPPPASQTLQQDESSFYDNDEFEGFEKTAKPVVKEEKVEPVPEEEVKPITPKEKFGPLEITYITFITVFVVSYFIGKSNNDGLANAWGKKYAQLITSNFNKFGDSDRFILTKDSANTFSVTASGRARCHGALITLNLKKRHDLTALVTSLFSPQKDQLIIDVAMQSHQPFCFGLAKKKEEKQMLKAYKDVSDFGLQAKLPVKLAAMYTAYTDSAEIIDDVFTREIIEILASNPTHFSSIGYTDRSITYLQYKSILRVVYNLPSAQDMNQIADLMRLVFLLIDSLSTVSLSKTSLVRNESMRKKSAAATQEKSEHEIRQEIAQQKKQDRLQAERAAYDKMSPEQQAKIDDKEAKRKVKAKQAKVKVMYS